MNLIQEEEIFHIAHYLYVFIYLYYMTVYVLSRDVIGMMICDCSNGIPKLN